MTGTRDGLPMLFAHGFGCDQHMWRYVWPAFAADHQIVLFDHVGAGGSDLHAFDPEKYASLTGYVEDILDVCRVLDLDDVIFVGHSVASIMGVLAAIEEPTRFSKLVLVGPSPRYVNDDGYFGGFAREEIDALLASLEANYLGWSAATAPLIMGTPDRPDLEEELTNSFCRTDPDIARQFARVTFLSDNRADLAKVQTPTLVLQCSQDAIAPTPVGEYVHGEIDGSVFVHLRATGHCPNLSAPEETIEAIRGFL